MCGLAGIIFSKLEDKSLLKNSIVKMSSLIQHRGPDQNGFLEFQNLFLSHLRYAVMDPRNLGRQPMSVDDRYSIIFNYLRHFSVLYWHKVAESIPLKLRYVSGYHI